MAAIEKNYIQWYCKIIGQRQVVTTGNIQLELRERIPRVKFVGHLISRICVSLQFAVEMPDVQASHREPGGKWFGFQTCHIRHVADGAIVAAQRNDLELLRLIPPLLELFQKFLGQVGLMA